MPSLSSIINVGAPVVGGILNRKAAGSATNKLTTGVNTAIGTVQAGGAAAGKTLKDVYDEQKGLLDPYRNAGMPALNTLQQGTAPGGDFVKPFDANTFDLYKDPSFNWRVSQGEAAAKAEANAGGIRYSGATLKALESYRQNEASKEWAAARGRSVEDQTNAYNRTKDMANLGYDATGREVDAGTSYGNNTANVQTSTARSIADLQTDLASAQAAGDVAKASSITDAINGAMQGIDKASTAKSLAQQALGIGLKPGAIGTPGGGFGAGLGGTLGTWGGTSTSVGAGGLPATTSVASSGILGGVHSGLATAGHALTGALGAIPLAGQIALGIGGGILLGKKVFGIGNTHEKADVWTKGKDGQGGNQNKFDSLMAEVDNGVKNGTVTPEQAQQAKSGLVGQYLSAAAEFAAKGKDQKKVIENALRTFRAWYPEFSAGVA